VIVRGVEAEVDALIAALREIDGILAEAAGGDESHAGDDHPDADDAE